MQSHLPFLAASEIQKTSTFVSSLSNTLNPTFVFYCKGTEHLPFNVNPLSATPSLRFFRTTFLTSSRAWGANGVLKQIRWKGIFKIFQVKTWHYRHISLIMAPEHFIAAYVLMLECQTVTTSCQKSMMNLEISWFIPSHSNDWGLTASSVQVGSTDTTHELPAEMQHFTIKSTEVWCLFILQKADKHLNWEQA